MAVYYDREDETFKVRTTFMGVFEIDEVHEFKSNLDKAIEYVGILNAILKLTE